MSQFVFFLFDSLVFSFDSAPELFFLMTSQVIALVEATVATANRLAFGVNRTTVNVLAIYEFVSRAIAFRDVTTTTSTTVQAR